MPLVQPPCQRGQDPHPHGAIPPKRTVLPPQEASRLVFVFVKDVKPKRDAVRGAACCRG